jgi:hypothetical protein
MPVAPTSQLLSSNTVWVQVVPSVASDGIRILAAAAFGYQRVGSDILSQTIGNVGVLLGKVGVNSVATEPLGFRRQGTHRWL